MNGQVNQKFRDLAEKSVAPQFKEATKVEVDFLSEGNLIEKYCEIEYYAIEYALRKVVSTVEFTKKEFVQYCKTLLASRIEYVLGGKPTVYPTDHIMVPSFLENILMQIGEAMDLSLGIRILPKKITLTPMSLENMRKISMRLESLDGYEGGFGYPRDKTGSWDFMTMTLVNNDIRRHDAQAHPVYALMAAVVGPKLISSVLSPMVTYGTTDLFEGLLWQLTSI